MSAAVLAFLAALLFSLGVVLQQCGAIAAPSASSPKFLVSIFTNLFWLDAGRPILHRDREAKSAPLVASLIASGPASRLASITASSGGRGCGARWSGRRCGGLVADGLSEREIARRLGMNRRTVARLARSEEPPRYRRPRAGSKLDQFVPVLRRLLAEWPQIRAPRATELLREEYGYDGSVDLVKRRLRLLRPPVVRAAQRTGYRPGQVLQLDWAGDADSAAAGGS